MNYLSVRRRSHTVSRAKLTPWFLAITRSREFCSFTSRATVRLGSPTCYILQEGISASRSGIARLIKRYEETGSIDRRSGSSRPTKITDEMKFIVDGQMEKDDKTTVQELHVHATLYDGGYSVSKSTVLR